MRMNTMILRLQHTTFSPDFRRSRGCNEGNRMLNFSHTSLNNAKGRVWCGGDKMSCSLHDELTLSLSLSTPSIWQLGKNNFDCWKALPSPLLHVATLLTLWISTILVGRERAGWTRYDEIQQITLAKPWFRALAQWFS